MNLNKKALQTYILVTLIVSVVLTAFIMSVLEPLFLVNDPLKCHDYNFKTLNDECIDGGMLKVSVENTGNITINFKSNDVSSGKYKVSSKFTETLIFPARSDTVEIIPYVEDFKSKSEMDCEGKAIKIDTRRLMKCLE